MLKQAIFKHADAQRMLYDLALSAGAKVDFGVDVVSVTAGDPKPIVTLGTGQTITADIVIGADGPFSIVRRTAIDMETDLEPTGMVVYSGTISANKVLKDPVLAPFLQADEVSCDSVFSSMTLTLLNTEQWPIFMGSHRSVCCKCLSISRNAVIWANSLSGHPMVCHMLNLKPKTKWHSYTTAW